MDARMKAISLGILLHMYQGHVNHRGGEPSLTCSTVYRDCHPLCHQQSLVWIQTMNRVSYRMGGPWNPPPPPPQNLESLYSVFVHIKFDSKIIARIIVSDCVRSNLRRSNKKKISWGSMPPDPPSLHTHETSSHTCMCAYSTHKKKKHPQTCESRP